ncbi:hypothetical protein ACTXT7_016455 [Hymenolepis weldensis]
MPIIPGSLNIPQFKRPALTDIYSIRSNTGEDLALGVYHSGVLVYRGRLRMQHYTWARIVELSYKGKEFIMVVRPVIFDEYIESPGGRRRTSVSSRNASGSAERGTFKQRSRSAKPSADAHRNMTLTFKCLNSEMAKRLYNVVVDHHTFFSSKGVVMGTETGKDQWNLHVSLTVLINVLCSHSDFEEQNPNLLVFFL